jgi:PAS domain-containing protein
MDVLTLAEKRHIEPMHDLLKRQLKQHFGGLDSIPEEWQSFIKTVNDAYWESDRNLIALEHTLESTTEDLAYASSEIHALFQVIPDLFLVLDSEDTILECQSRMGIDLHIAPGNFVGRQVGDVSIDQISNELLEAIHKARKAKSIVSIEYATSSQKRINFYEARLLPLPENRIIAVVRNTTEHKRAELEIQNLQRYNRGLIETSLDPLD